MTMQHFFCTVDEDPPLRSREKVNPFTGDALETKYFDVPDYLHAGVPVPGAWEMRAPMVLACATSSAPFDTADSA